MRQQLTGYQLFYMNDLSPDLNLEILHHANVYCVVFCPMGAKKNVLDTIPDFNVFIISGLIYQAKLYVRETGFLRHLRPSLHVRT